MATQSPSPEPTKAAPQPSPAEGYGTTIESTILCASCGCNLKGYPWLGSCPQCGTTYSARRAVSPSVYVPGLAEFPWTRLIIFVFAAAVTPLCTILWLSLGRHAMLPVLNFIPLGAIIFGGLAVYQFPVLIVHACRYVRQRTWERRHAQSIAEDRARKEERRAALGPSQHRQDRPCVLPSDAALARLTLEGHMAPLDWPALCATCGYRLQGLSRKGICPECGTSYCTHTHQMRNILSPYEGRASGADTLLAVVCTAIALIFLYSMISTFYVTKMVFAVLFVAGAYGFAAVAMQKNRRYRFAKRALKEIQAEEQDE